MQLSIVIPVYNVEAYIERALNSIFQQSVTSINFEVVIVDDGTPDDSMFIVERFRQKYPSIITIIRQKNKGLSGARNAGLNKARGKYVWFIDSDDTIENNSINTLLEITKQNDYDVILTNLRWVNVEASHIDYSYKNSKYVGQVINGIKCLEEKMQVATSPRYILRRDFLSQHNLIFHEGIYHEDMEFGVKMMFFAQKVFVTDKVFYNYLIRENDSITANFKIKRSYDCISIAQELENFRDLYAQNKKEKRIINAKILLAIISSLYICARFSNKQLDFEDLREFVDANKFIFKSCGRYLFISKFDFFLCLCGFSVFIHPLLFFYIMKFKNQITMKDK